MQLAPGSHQALTRVPSTDVLDVAELGKLGGFIDDAHTFVEAINDQLPVTEVDIRDAGDDVGTAERLRLTYAAHPGPRSARRS